MVSLWVYEERAGMTSDAHALRIRDFRCNTCRWQERFPRHHGLLNLLDTRIGYCSDWVTAFTCMCVVLGHEARLCVNQTSEDMPNDIWTEVYIEEQ